MKFMKIKWKIKKYHLSEHFQNLIEKPQNVVIINSDGERFNQQNKHEQHSPTSTH